MFDCWMQEQEEDRQPSHIARCRSGFTEAIMALGPAPAPGPMAKASEPPKPVKPETWPKKYVVFFGHDSIEVNITGQNRIATAVASAKKHRPSSVVVTGHTDRSGDRDYNMMLSKRRADAVVGALVDGGVPIVRFKQKSYGEDQPRVKTSDGERNARNRAVEITLHK